MQELQVNLFFVGIKHSGKTTFAKRISSRLSLPSFDTDDLILLSLNGESVRDFYKREGKEAFMKIRQDFRKKKHMLLKSFILTLFSIILAS